MVRTCPKCGGDVPERGVYYPPRRAMTFCTCNMANEFLDVYKKVY